VGKCSNGADTPAGTDCAADFAVADTFSADDCTAGCVWTPAPVAPTMKPTHPIVASFPGYSHLSGACRSTSPDRLFDESEKMTERPPYIYREKNTDFPAFPEGTSPSELITLCEEINNLNAADPATNPASCLGFHSGPYVSIFGPNIGKWDPEGPWKFWDEGSGAIDLTGTKPNHQYVCYIKGNLCPGGVDPAPAGDNGCNYGACFNPLAVEIYHTRCVHGPSSCSSQEQYYTPEQVMEYGMSCKCTDILDYPSTIGMCDRNGVHTPMAVDSDCASAGSAPVCNSVGGIYSVGDPAAAAFSACDLTCNHLHQQTISPPARHVHGLRLPRSRVDRRTDYHDSVSLSHDSCRGCW
jgi:hypothetical protein